MRRFHSVSGSCGALAGKTVLLRKNFLYLIILSQFTPLGFQSDHHRSLSATHSLLITKGLTDFCKSVRPFYGSGRISFAKRQRDMVCRCLVE